MLLTRRHFLKKMMIVSASGLYMALNKCLAASSTIPWLGHYFAPNSFDLAWQRFYGDIQIPEAKAITLNIPRIAEDGAVVPVTINAEFKQVESIALWVEKNPTPLAVIFDLSPQIEAKISARIKMAETCDVIAVVKTPDGFYQTRQHVKVTLGGCGG